MTEPTDLELHIEALKSQLDLRGIKYHHKAGLEKLKSLLEEADAEDLDADNAEVGQSPRAKHNADLAMQEEMRKKCLRLRRIMVTCNDPLKIKWRGEIIQGGNSVLGNVRKYIPFGNPNGWYVPEILITVMKEKVFRRENIKENDPMSGGLAPTYSITYLDDLTPQQLADLKHQQSLRNAGGYTN